MGGSPPLPLPPFLLALPPLIVIVGFVQVLGLCHIDINTYRKGLVSECGGEVTIDIVEKRCMGPA